MFICLPFAIFDIDDLNYDNIFSLHYNIYFSKRDIYFIVFLFFVILCDSDFCVDIYLSRETTRA